MKKKSQNLQVDNVGGVPCKQICKVYLLNVSKDNPFSEHLSTKFPNCEI